MNRYFAFKYLVRVQAQFLRVHAHDQGGEVRVETAHTQLARLENLTCRKWASQVVGLYSYVAFYVKNLLTYHPRHEIKEHAPTICLTLSHAFDD